MAVLLACASWIQAGEAFHIAVTGNYFSPSDEDYRSIYGEAKVVPELEAGIAVFRGLYGWISYGYLGAEGTLPVVEDAATSTHHQISAGAGYRVVILGFMELGIRLGSFNVIYSEKTQGDEKSGLAFGYRGDFHWVLYAGRRFFLGISGGYLRAAKTLQSNSVVFGGFRGGLVMGFRF
jgi:hypothetical protein